jgi:hypothetical protein
MFDFLKKKKDDDFPEGDLDFPPVAETPINEVIEMRKQGMTNDQIISKLKAEGYNFSQIQNAMSQAEVKGSAVPAPAIPLPDIALPEPATPTFDEPTAVDLQKPEPVRAGKDDIERLLEQIIEEKWKGVTNKLDAIESWKVGIEAKMTTIDKGIATLNDRIDKVQASAASKTDEYDRTMQDVQTEMKALEKIMGKLIPSMTDTIKELRDIAEETKRG